MHKPFDCPFRGEGTLLRSFSAEHPKLDFTVPWETPVTAVESGVVRSIRRGSEPPHNIVELAHNRSTRTLISQIGKILVSVGDMVSVGQIIGYAGHPPKTPESELSFQLLVKGQPKDPRPFIELSENSPSQPKMIFRVMIPRLFVRSGPDTDYPIIGSLPADALFIGTDPTPDHWTQIGHNAFTRLEQKGEIFCERLRNF